MNCSKSGCTHAATHKVVLELKANARDSAATSTPLVYVCDEHKDVQWGDVVDDKGWHTIRENFKAQGFFPPSKVFSRVLVLPMELVQ